MDHRLVSPIEMYSVARHNLNFYKTISFYLRFEIISSRFSLEEWRPKIERALRLTIDAQPRLRLQVDQTRSKVFFIILSDRIFDILPIRVIEHDNLIKVLEDESNTSFDYNQHSALWRVILLTNPLGDYFHFIISFNHAIADGISGMAFLRSFVDFLVQRPSVHYQLSDDRPVQELIPSKLPPLSKLFVKIIEKLLLPKQLRQYFFPKTYWTGNRPVTGDETNKTRFISLELPQSIVDPLHNRCRLEQTTVTAAVLSALLLSISDVYGDDQMKFSCNVAVNLRPFCQPKVSNGQMGVFVSGADTFHYIPFENDQRKFFWPLARQIKEQMTEEIEHSTLELIQMLKFVSNWNDFLLKQRRTLPNGCQHSVDLSNLLRWSLDGDETTWRISHGGFCQSSNLVGSRFTASVVTINGNLTMFICYQEKSIENVEEMRDRLRNYLIDSAR